MKSGLRSLALTTVTMMLATAPAYAHPGHGFHVSGALHSLAHALDAAGFLFLGLTLVIVTGVTIKTSLRRSGDRRA
jgi:hypothetical protein